MIGLLPQGGAESFDWATEFRPFSPFHWVVNAACFALMAAPAGLGIAWRSTPKEQLLRRSLAIFILISQVGLLIYYMWPPFDIGYNLPLHICDLAGWIAGMALFTQARWLRNILYYWGIGLSTQAFITPVLTSGYTAAEFWAFWGLHVMIVGAAVYDLAVLRYRPSWKDLKSSVIITAAYAGAIFFFNRAVGTNYLYLGESTPENPTIIDHLGPWPLRALWVGLIVTAGFIVLTAIWPSNWKRPASATFTAAPPSPPGPNP